MNIPIVHVISNNLIFTTLLEFSKNLLLPLGLLILFLLLFITYALMTHFKLKKKVGKVDEALEELARSDPIWKKEQLLAFIDFFSRELIKAWSGKDRTKLKGLLSGDLFISRKKILDQMDALGQYNVIVDLKIREILFVDVQDFTNDEFDRFTARIRYDAVNFTKNYRDKWEEPKWGEDVDGNPEMESKEYIEFWTFERSGDTWKLHRMEKEWKEGNYIASDPLLEDEKYTDEEPEDEMNSDVKFEDGAEKSEDEMNADEGPEMKQRNPKIK